MTERSPVDLLAAYRRGDFFLATENRTMLGRGIYTAVSDADEFALAERVRTLLLGKAEEQSGPDEADLVAVGALPFDSDATTPGHVVVPENVHVAGALHPAAAALPRHEVPRPVAIRPVPEPSRHVEAVATAVTALAERNLRKVVLARALDVEFAGPVGPEGILHNLVVDNDRGYTFAAELPNARTLVGASPELLLSRRGRTVVSHPHAGSAPRSADPTIDRENAESLLASRKDHIEHAVLTEAIVETLRPYCARLDVPPRPALVSTPTMWHLGTTITGELSDPGVTALHLAAALHPTPAICGTPTPSARRLVTELEEFDRGYYAGAVGWVDAQGDGEWAVSIRCAELAEQSLRLYAGGGIVPESDPKAELAETSAKFATLLRAMGLPQE
ncbi:isochorismate synthase [Saccharomonospora xinjiangensis]|uniref:isochorismate synthase n=1 Tax=Saccharomonospora xinjiangensis TaxID=75294 RepID=UPI0010701C39|nr:isochorismate synthase [Saccharomonospora xinjiangensis]QBQ62055.1 Isochorismate synthase DhbC [Saccharomonospora xinjiangensis]